MIRSFYAVPAMFCLAAALVTAQAPPAEQPAAQQPAAQQPTTPRPSTPATPAQQPTRPDASTANKVTYTGCIKPGATEGTWILENAEVAQRADAASPPSTVGTSGASKMSFNLDPAATVNLKSHANHKVELVGTLSASKSGAAAAPSAAAGGASTTGAAARQQFSVESLKMVSATCP
jgi:hypothetical protein